MMHPEQSSPAFLLVQDLLYRGAVGTALQPLRFELEAGERLAIMGETGSGKSTLLKLIAGHLQATSGTVYFKGDRVRGPWETLLPGHPGIAYLSQHFELRNNYKVFDLLDYYSRMDEAAAARIFDICGITHLLPRKTDQLSGGERQRIALAGLLVGAPKLLLLDEPFSNADLAHKQAMRAVLQQISTELDITCVLVSHDPADTLSWCNRLMIFKDGALRQDASPDTVYYQPADAYCAGITGWYNAVKPDSQVARQWSLQQRPFLRPEQLVFCEASTPGSLPVSIEAVQFMGACWHVQVRIADMQWLVSTTVLPAEKEREAIRLR